MPTSVYLNSGAKDLSVAGNYTPGAAPVNGDDFSIVEGSQAVDAGQSTLTAVNLVNFFGSEHG